MTQPDRPRGSHPPHVAHDFATEFHRARPRLMFDFIGFDASTERLHTVGWARPAVDEDGTPCCDAIAPIAQVSFYVDRRRGLSPALELALESDVELLVNATRVAVLRAHPPGGAPSGGRRRYSFDVPSSALVLGENVLTLAFRAGADAAPRFARAYTLELDPGTTTHRLYGGAFSFVEHNLVHLSRVCLGGDTRVCVLQMPKSAVTFDKCYVPPGSSLTFQLGFHPKARASVVRASVFVKRFRPQGDASVVGEEVFAVELSPADGWQPFVVDLASLAGAVVTFSFNVSADVEPSSVLVAWAEPRVLTTFSPTGPNIVLLTLDALRRDHVSCYGAAGATPNIDAFAREAVRYDDCFSVASWTLPSLSSYYTSLYPPYHGVTATKLDDPSPSGSRLLAERFPTLPCFLRPLGYATHAISTHAYFKDGYSINRDYDAVLLDRANMGLPVFPQVYAEWLARNGRGPFFLHVHIMPPHSPYKCVAPFEPTSDGPAKVLATYIERDRLDASPLADADRKARIVDLYAANVALGDEHLGDIVRCLKEAGVYDDALVVVAADHGEQFWEHGACGHQKSVYNEEVRVPLLVKYPSGAPGVQRGRVLTIDVLPTLLDCLGAPRPDYFQGRPLRESASDAGRRPAFLSQAWVKPDREAVLWETYKFITTRSGESEELYDLATDPQERENLVSKEPGVVASMRRALQAFWAAAPVHPGDETRPPGEPDARPQNEQDRMLADHLRSLGYKVGTR